MAAVQALPVRMEGAAEGAAPAHAAMGSVGSVLAGRPRRGGPGGASPASAGSDSDEPREERAGGGSLRGPPPRLVPVSGRLEEDVEKTLIRPMAFKPVVPKGRPALSESPLSLAQLLGEQAGAPGGRAATLSDSGRTSLSSLPAGGGQPAEGAARAGSPRGAQHEAPAGGRAGPCASDSGRSSSSKSSGSLGGRGRRSPESGSSGRSPPPAAAALLARALEETLRGGEAELRRLRHGLDGSDGAACQVSEAEPRRCEQEPRGLRPRQAAPQAPRGQQLLQLQVLQLQQEKKQLQEDFAQLLQERELLERRCASFQREHTELAPRLEETKWEVCQKSGEISLLKQQLKEAQAELAQRGAELLALRAQLRAARGELQAGEQQARALREAARLKALELEACAGELQRRRGEAELLRAQAGRLEREAAALRAARGGGAGAEAAAAALRRQLERLRAEVAQERQRGREQRAAFERERSAWQGDKERVIRYQKQLQCNYIHMYRRNRRLEQRLQRLRLRGEEPPPEPGGAASPEPPFEDIAATEI
ncbi:leucine zipper putative tumor suppressor 2 [Eudromia elegans]